MERSLRLARFIAGIFVFAALQGSAGGLACSYDHDEHKYIPRYLTLAETQRALTGTWLSDCHESTGEQAATVWKVTSLTYAAADLVINESIYSDVECSERISEDESEWTYEITAGREAEVHFFDYVSKDTGDARFQLIQIQDVDRLYLGKLTDALDGLTAKKRPQLLERSVSYLEQPES